MIEIGRTLFIIKPGAVGAGNMGDILSVVTKNGFSIVAMKMIHISGGVAARFYAEHSGRPFFASLVDYMSSRPVVVCVLSGENNAVARLRSLIGNTDPQKAEAGTIRALYGKDLTDNAVHASDSEQSAARELRFFFAESDILE